MSACLVTCLALPAVAAREWRSTGTAPMARDGPSGRATDDSADTRALETRVLELLNAERTSRGLLPLERVAALDAAARANTDSMARSGKLHHSPPADLQRVPIRWRALGENVGVAATVQEVHRLMMGSRGHRANVLRSMFNAVGIAVAYGDDRRYYVTEVFASRAP